MGGGGKGGGGCQTVGYGYTLDMAYALVERFDWLNGYSWNGNIEYQDWSKTDSDNYNGDTQNPFIIYVQTGKQGDVYSSNIDHKTHIQVYNGTSRVNYPHMVGSPYINKIGCAIFENAFVGDNTTTIPNYKFSLSRWTIYDGNSYKIKEGVNPPYVILEFLVNYMGIPTTNIDMQSFQDVAQKCIDEGIGISFILQESHKIIDQIKDILRVIDGALYFNILTQKWTLFIIRKDYAEEDVVTIDDYNAKNINVTTGDWSKTITTYVFTYSNYKTGKTESLRFRNDSLIRILGQEKTKTYNFNIIGNADTMNVVANRIVQKNSKPLATLKCQLNFLEIPNIHLGQVVKLYSANLNIPEMYFRIMKIGADKEWQTYVEIEAMEDLYLTDKQGSINVGGDDEPPMSAYQIDTTVDKAHILFFNNMLFDDQKTNLSQYYYTILGSGIIPNNNFVTGIKSLDTLTNRSVNYPVNIYGELDTSYTIPEFDRAFELTIHNLEGKFNSNINLSDEEWQKGDLLVFIQDTIFSFKNMIVNGDDSITLKGVLGYLNGNYHTSYSSGSRVFVLTGQALRDLTITKDSALTLNRQLAFFNPYTTGEYTAYSATSDLGYINKPLPPENVKAHRDTDNDNIDITFGAVGRGSVSPVIQNADLVTGGDGEYSYEHNLSYEIGYNDDIISVIVDDNTPIKTLTIQDDGQNLSNFWVRSVYYDTYKSNKTYATEQ